MLVLFDKSMFNAFNYFRIPIDARIDGKTLLAKGFNENRLKHLHPSSSERKDFQRQRARLK